MQAINTLPPGPQIPELIRILKLIFQPVQYLEDLFKIYGDHFTVTTRGGINYVYFSHPEALQQIFTADPSQFKTGGGSEYLRFLLGDNSLIMLDGDRHQRERQLLTPPFHGERMRVYGETICEISQQVSNNWKMGKPFTIRASIQEITLRVMLRLVFGLEEGAVFEKLRLLLISLLDAINSPLMSSVIFLPFIQKDLGAWSPWGRIVRLRKQVDDLINALIQERRAESQKNRQDILSLLMCATDQNGQGMSDQEINDELMTLLVAGHETTASALTWAFYWVDYIPEVGKNLQRELETVGDHPDPNVISKLPYLTAVCQESLRIYPIGIEGISRSVEYPIEIMGYKLPKGTIVIPSIYIAHHREQTYPQPNQFKPERFLERQFSLYEFLPFGGGNRRCIGFAFAQYEMKLIISTILSRFQVSLVKKRPVTPVRRGFTVTAPLGMQMIANPLK